MLQNDIESGGSSGWLLDPSTLTTSPPSVNQTGFLASATSGLQQAAGTLLLKAFSPQDNSSGVSFDQWFFNGSSSADVYILGAFLLFLFACLILSPIVAFVICTRSRSSSNAVLFHYFAANFLFLVGQLIRFVRAQQAGADSCPKLGQVGPWFFMDVLATPIAYIALGLLAVERFVFYTGHTLTPLRWLRSPVVLSMALVVCWLLLAGLDVGLFLLLRMLSLSDFLRPVAAQLTGVFNKGVDSQEETAPVNPCADPLAGRILGPVRDIITALFVCTVAIPSIGSFVMQTILHCVMLRATNRKPSAVGSQRATTIAFGVIASHLGLTLPHTTIGIFVPGNYRALAWLLTLRTLQHLIAVILFLALDPASYAMILTYLLRRKSPMMSSTLNRTGGDIDNLIASVDVTPNTMAPHAFDVNDHVGVFSGGGMSHHPNRSVQHRPDLSKPQDAAQHPYLSIRPAQLYFERPDSTTAINGRGVVETTFPASLEEAPRMKQRPGGAVPRPLVDPASLYSNSDRPFEHFGQPARSTPLPPYPPMSSYQQPPPLPPRRWQGGRSMRHHSGQVATSRSLPSTRRQFASRRHESHHDLFGATRRGPSQFNQTPFTPGQRVPSRHHHQQQQQRMCQSDYRLSLCDERFITIDGGNGHNCTSPGGWFDYRVTNDDEV